MAWVESHSASFTCRHSAACTPDVARMLAGLEGLRAGLAVLFPVNLSDLTLVLHDGPRSLVAANPLMAVLWRRTDPASRALVTGWVADHEIHLLSPPALAERSANNPSLAAVLTHAAGTLYTRRVIIAANPGLRRMLAPARAVAAVRWAWLLEGASRWFSGEAAAARPLLVARLRGGPQPTFPPQPRDAPLLAATVIDLLVREQGEPAAVALCAPTRPGDPQEALVSAFGGRSIVHTEGAWRSYLSRLAYSSG